MENGKILDSFRGEKAHSLSHALNILNDAAKDSSSEVRMMIKQDLKRVKDVIDGIKSNIPNIQEKFKESAKSVDNSARENPWLYIGATAATAGLFGYLLGRRK